MGAAEPTTSAPAASASASSTAASSSGLPLFTSGAESKTVGGFVFAVGAALMAFVAF